jgi:Tol biopolymer transport system component
MNRRWHAVVALAPVIAGGCDTIPVEAVATDPAVAESAALASAQAGRPVSPEVFAPGVISDHREQYRITFSPSGDTAYFGASDAFFPASRQAFIYQSVRVGGEWGEPEIASFSGEFSDIDPFISPDGQRLYFSSIRPIDGVDRPDLNTWVVERVGDGWSQPSLLPTVNSTNDDLYPSVDREGNLYFASTRPRPDLIRAWNIWTARRIGDGYAEPEPLGDGINSERTWEFNPAISPDGERLVFTRLDIRDQPGTHFGEIMVSHFHRGEWTTALNIGAPVNSPLDEFHPSFSPDGKTLYFVRRDPTVEQAVGDIYHVPVSALGDRLRRGASVRPGG